MTDLIYDFISQGVDMILTGGILSVIIILLQTSTTLTSLIATQQAHADMVDYYRQFNHVDNKDVSTSQLLALLGTWREDLSATVVVSTHNLHGNEGWKVYILTMEDGKYTYRDSGDASRVWSNISLADVKKSVLKDANYKYHVYILEDGESWSDIQSDADKKFYNGGAVTGFYVEPSP